MDRHPNSTRVGTCSVKLKSYYAKEIVPVFVKSGFDVVTSTKTLGFEDAGRKVLYWNYLLRKRIHP